MYPTPIELLLITPIEFAVTLVPAIIQVPVTVNTGGLPGKIGTSV